MIDCFFAAEYLPTAPSITQKHFERLAVLAELLRSDNELSIRWHAPEMASIDELFALHDADYVRAMLSGTSPLSGAAHLPWSQSLVDACRFMLGGQKAAARLAMERGFAMNLALGFHHAHPERGGGFCVFNGLAHVARCFPDRRIVVLDCDEHGGDGTAVFAERLSNLHAISVFGSRFGLLPHERSHVLQVPRGEHAGRSMLEAIAQALDIIHNLNPDLVLYQAGADMHIDDAKSTLHIDGATIELRDHQVLQALHVMQIPTLCSLGGSYQAVPVTAQIYSQTVRTSHRIFLRPDRLVS